MGSSVAGALAVLTASLFWGSNFVVTKNFSMGDGMHFQLMLCIGILMVGFFTLLWAQRSEVKAEKFDEFPLPDYFALISTEGLLGGFVWAIGNLLTVPIVERIGVGLGLSIWGGFGTILSFMLSRVTLFGFPPEELQPEFLGYFGAFLGVLSLVVFSQIETNTVDKRSFDNLGEEMEISEILESNGIGLESRLIEDRSQTRDGAEEEEEGSNSKSRRVEGIAMAFLAGTMYGFQFVPLTIHSNQYPTPTGVNKITHQIRFFFSQYVGIFLTSLLSFIVYTLYKGNKPHLIQPEAILPSIISGVLWGIACMGSMVAVAELGLGVGYPLTTNGAFMVNACWSIFFYQEVTGRRNLIIFTIAGILNILSCICLAIARS